MREFTDESIRWILVSFDNRTNTAEMAERWPKWTEAEFERALHIGLERRRVQRVAEAIGANV